MGAAHADTESFVPGPETRRAFRDALGRFGTGVTVVTAMGEDGPVGITANSFASVSLDPPLVLWSPARNSARYPVFAAAARFAIHIMGAEQTEIARGFARSGDVFAGLDWLEGEGGAPLLHGCLARFECRKTAEFDGGDHLIILGEVRRAEMRGGEPLLFCRGTFGRFTGAA